MPQPSWARVRRFTGRCKGKSNPSRVFTWENQAAFTPWSPPPAGQVEGICFPGAHDDPAADHDATLAGTPRDHPRPGPHRTTGYAPGSGWSIGGSDAAVKGEKWGDAERTRVAAGQAPKPTAARVPAGDLA